MTEESPNLYRVRAVVTLYNPNTDEEEEIEDQGWGVLMDETSDRDEAFEIAGSYNIDLEDRTGPPNKKEAVEAVNRVVSLEQELELFKKAALAFRDRWESENLAEAANELTSLLPDD
jgi:hypothetical protein